MPKENTENKVKIQQVKEALIYGEINEKGKRTYPSLKAACEKIGANYDSVRHQLKVKDLKEERARVKAEMDAAIKKEKSDHQTEESVIGDDKFKKDADLLRIATTLKIQKIKDDLDNGFDVSSYHLMNAGKALESAQKVYKTAVGEPSDITKVEGKSEVTVKEPQEEIRDLEDTLNQDVSDKTLDEIIPELDPNEDKLQRSDSDK